MKVNINESKAVKSINIPGRTCPVDYSMGDDFFLKREDEIICEAVYVVGGLYGNYQALDEIIRLSLEEKEKVTIVFNGDIHWFDKDLIDFKRLESVVKKHIPLLGNVEAELFRNEDIDVGCGCSYPDCVDEEAVMRSNKIHSMMKANISVDKSIIKELSSRKKGIVVKVDDIRIAITHGDEKSLAGWMCSRDNLVSSARQEELKSWFEKNDIGILATTHTCAPAAISIGDHVVINNGAAGMPNFSNTKYGVITRISRDANEKAIYRAIKSNLFVEAIPVNYNFREFITWFDNNWSLNSPASISYRDRIVHGTNDSIEDAIINGFKRI
ncbi:calcineurin phosphoesterase [Peptostreptococcus sp. D1]|uniref:calcineurin phosphoesterase n=1 Tax=Peptostreptococcus sp. D1 TaxID=72304 RepID=UPI0008EFCE91|nr:calcineurin phosphoesterase [Peptostreptococcus sp. D1]SFE72340.1 hypothetical protein SAMN02910278_01544 [Peptostreptococcus sp. D1]